MKNLTDVIIEYLETRPEGVSSKDLCEQFLRFRNPTASLATHTMQAIIGSDNRCRFNDNDLWVFSPHKNGSNITELSWIVVFVFNVTKDFVTKPAHISVWSCMPLVNCLYSQWVIDLCTLSNDERELLTSTFDSVYCSPISKAIGKLNDIMQNRFTVYLSYSQQQIINKLCYFAHEFISDDSLLLGQLCSISGVTIQTPITIESCYQSLFGSGLVCSSAASWGEALAQCCHELLVRIAKRGIKTYQEFRQKEEADTITIHWPYLKLGIEELLNLPSVSGVYCFKDNNHRIVYIGKAKNLKRRLMSYFRSSEESVEKRMKLRDQVYFLNTYPCGSELESLILEYRLIIKYKPLLNAQVQINERKGSFKPLGDFIVVLNHADVQKGLLCLYRENQKIFLVEFFADFREKDLLVQKIEEFFFTQSLPCHTTDFPEHEIVLRWVKKHEPELIKIDLFRFKNSEEVFAQIKACWKQLKKEMSSTEVNSTTIASFVK